MLGLKLFEKTKQAAVSFCDRCGRVCDAACRADAIRERARMQSLLHGWRIA